METQRGLRKNLAYLLGARAVTFLSKGVYTVVVARALGPDAYGILSYSISWSVAFLAFASLALWPVLSREVALDRNKGLNIAANMLSLRFVLSVLAALASAVLAWWTEEDLAVRGVLWVVSFALMGRSVATYCENYFNALERSSVVFSQEAIFRSVELLLAATAALTGYGPQWVVWAYAFSWWAQAFRGLWLIERKGAGLRLKAQPPVLVSLVRKGIPLTVSSMSMLLLATGPLLLVRHRADAHQLGQLALLTQAFALMSHVPMQVAIAGLPHISRSLKIKDEAAWAFLDISLRGSVVFVVLLFLGATALGPIVVPWVAGSGFSQAGEFLGVFLALLLPRSWGTLLWQTLLADNRIWQGAVAAVSGLAVLIFVLLSAGSNVTMVTAVLAMAAGQAVWVVLCLLLVAKVHRHAPWRRILGAPLLFAGTVGAVFALAAPVGHWWAVGLSTGVAGLLLLATPVLSAEEKSQLLRRVKGLSNGRLQP